MRPLFVFMSERGWTSSQGPRLMLILLISKLHLISSVVLLSHHRKYVLKAAYL